MKNQLALILFFTFSFLACGSSDDAMQLIDDQSDSTPMADPNASFTGNFVSDAHVTTGMVEVNMDKSIISFNNFMTDDGPKLLVYLSTSVSSTDYVDLGDLKGIKGNYMYSIPANTDLEKYKYVVIWCVDFLVSFGHAELK